MQQRAIDVVAFARAAVTDISATSGGTIDSSFAVTQRGVCWSTNPNPTTANTKTIDGLAYELGVGLRYDFSDTLAADGTYKMRWVDFESAASTPSFDGLQLSLVWKF